MFARHVLGLVSVVAAVVLLAHTDAVRAGGIDRADTAFLKWVPVLIADQKALFSATQIYLKSPGSGTYDDALAAGARLRKHVDATQETFRVIVSDSNTLRRIRSEMDMAASNFRQAGTYWNDFLRRYWDALTAQPSSNLRVMYAQHDTAELWFNRAWSRISLANALLGSPIGNERMKPPPAAIVRSVGSVTGAYAVSFTCSSGCSGTYAHRMTITSYDASSGRFAGSGFLVSDRTYTWKVTGALADGKVSFHIAYTGANAGYTVDAAGVVRSTRTWAGTAKDADRNRPAATLTRTATRSDE